VDYSKEILSGLLFATAFLLMKLNPVSVNLGLEIVTGLIALVIFASLVQIAGLVRLKSYYLAPIAALGFFDIRAAGIFLFAFFGKANVSNTMKNMIVPRMSLIAKAAYAGYLAFIIISMATIFPQIEFKVPDSVSGMAVELLVPAIGCQRSYTGQECLDSLVSETIDTQCGTNNACITLMNDQRSQIEESLFKRLKTQFLSFDRKAKVGDILSNTLDEQITLLVEPYQGVFKIIMAVVIFSVFQFLVAPLVTLSAMLTGILLRIMETVGVIEKKTVKVDKIIFSI